MAKTTKTNEVDSIQDVEVVENEGLQSFFFAKENVTIKAKTLEEAIAILKNSK